jgi:hypothetical protein
MDATRDGLCVACLVVVVAAVAWYRSQSTVEATASDSEPILSPSGITTNWLYKVGNTVISLYNNRSTTGHADGSTVEAPTSG